MQGMGTNHPARMKCYLIPSTVQTGYGKEIFLCMSPIEGLYPKYSPLLLWVMKEMNSWPQASLECSQRKLLNWTQRKQTPGTCPAAVGVSQQALLQPPPLRSSLQGLITVAPQLLFFMMLDDFNEVGATGESVLLPLLQHIARTAG